MKEWVVSIYQDDKLMLKLAVNGKWQKRYVRKLAKERACDEGIKNPKYEIGQVSFSELSDDDKELARIEFYITNYGYVDLLSSGGAK